MVVDLASGVEKKVDAIPQPGFKHKIRIRGRISVKDLAQLLAVQPRDILGHATRIGLSAKEKTILNESEIVRIAAREGYGVEVVLSNNPSVS